MKKILVLLTIVGVLFSCSENESKIYNGEQTLVYFGEDTAELLIEIDATGQLIVPVNASTLSSADRTVNIEVNVDDTTADSQNYTVPATVTIPAGEYSGDLVIDGEDITAETTPELLVLRISSFSDASAVISSQELEISVLQYCPIPSTSFVGNYLIEELTPYVDGPTLSDGTIVAVTATSETGRSFMTDHYPDYCANNPRAFNFSLVCGDVIAAADQSSTCACTSDGLFFGPATTHSTYDVNDDSVFELTFTNDVTGDCGSAVQTTYRFTKQ